MCIRDSFDAEDVALSAFHSLCEGAREDHFPDLSDRNELWALLTVITARKASHRLRARAAQKRGGGRVHGESILAAGSRARQGGIEQFIGREPTPEFAAQVAEESAGLLDFLEDDALRRVALLKLLGATSDEIADRLECGKRTVERRLEHIRRLWIARCDSDLS